MQALAAVTEGEGGMQHSMDQLTHKPYQKIGLKQ